MKQYIPVALLISFFSITSCENVLDCIINVRPELHDKVLSTGFVDEFYFENITADIKNEVRDNSYDYYFNVTGSLPEGIEAYYDTYRQVVLEGVPRQSGRFRFTVSLEVFALDSYYYDDFGNRRFNDPLCEDYTTKTYDIVVR